MDGEDPGAMNPLGRPRANLQQELNSAHYADVQTAMLTAEVLQFALGVRGLQTSQAAGHGLPGDPDVAAWLQSVALIDTGSSSAAFFHSIAQDDGVSLTPFPADACGPQLHVPVDM